ncbi:hypothetical protein RCC89_04535 [Cytophagaceae bacterium ABcell3]|nr:hypothetical protein RCC89_04535 [Cytophagaceae bacterium ABcell3]
MKKFLLALSFLAFSATSVFAQEEEVEVQESFRPVAGTMGFTFGLNNVLSGGTAGWFNTELGVNTPTLLFRYYVTDQIAARASVSYDMLRSTETDLEDGVETTERSAASTIQLALGGQYALGNHHRLEPYVGADLIFSRLGASEFTRSEVVHEDGGNVGDYMESDVSLGSEYGVGLVPFVGLNYFITRNIAVGAEFGWGYRATFAGGPSGTTTTRVDNQTTTSDIESDERTRSGSFGTFGTGALAISIFF